jgi:hypothetical protein
MTMRRPRTQAPIALGLGQEANHMAAVSCSSALHHHQAQRRTKWASSRPLPRFFNVLASRFRMRVKIKPYHCLFGSYLLLH